MEILYYIQYLGFMFRVVGSLIVRKEINKTLLKNEFIFCWYM